jgi:hypothetical protein
MADIVSEPLTDVLDQPAVLFGDSKAAQVAALGPVLGGCAGVGRPTSALHRRGSACSRCGCTPELTG